jgi:hypothetical protein
VDIYDARINRDPLGAVDAMAARGVRTLYIETANYRQPSRVNIVYPFQVAQMIDAAHAYGMKVVAWYLPSFLHVRRDLRRALAAIRFTTLSGGRFDSFALDIEANVVRAIYRRNLRALRLSRRIRSAVGSRYPLGAIVPDRRSTDATRPSLWPWFPYRGLRPYYDVFLPMSYSTYRGKGRRYVYGYTLDNISYLRFATGDPQLPVHVIGGLASRLGGSESGAVVQAGRDGGALGSSLYKFSLTGSEDWRAFAPVPSAPIPYAPIP